jgi:lycopene beta-cyclase
VDATGFESSILSRESAYTARNSDVSYQFGYQIAYGCISRVTFPGTQSIPFYDPEAMTLFDYRTDHVENDPEMKREAESRPTFLYVMPLSQSINNNTNEIEYRVFWEETSLVGRGRRRLTFLECQQRLLKRLEHYGAVVHEVEEEEFCYIPMGGELPSFSQRVLGFGAAANLVHPSTGYQLNRMLAAAPEVATSLARGIKAGDSPDEIVLNTYQHVLWPTQTRLQRDFQVTHNIFSYDDYYYY